MIELSIVDAAPDEAAPVVGAYLMDFAGFVRLCRQDREAAVRLARAVGGQAGGTELVDRFRREFQRIEVDMHYERRRVLELVHHIESDLLDKVLTSPNCLPARYAITWTTWCPNRPQRLRWPCWLPRNWNARRRNGPHITIIGRLQRNDRTYRRRCAG